MKNKYNFQINYNLIKIITKPLKKMWPENPSFMFSELCYCGHTNNDHILDNNRCAKQEACNCQGFFP